MKVRELIEALDGPGIKVRSIIHSGESTVYTFEGYLPQFPFGPLCLTSYPLVIDDDNTPLEPHNSTNCSAISGRAKSNWPNIHRGTDDDPFPLSCLV